MQEQPDRVQRVAKNAQAMRKLLQTIDGLQVLLVIVAMFLLHVGLSLDITTAAKPLGTPANPAHVQFCKGTAICSSHHVSSSVGNVLSFSELRTLCIRIMVCCLSGARGPK